MFLGYDCVRRRSRLFGNWFLTMSVQKWVDSTDCSPVEEDWLASAGWCWRVGLHSMFIQRRIRVTIRSRRLGRII